MRFFVYLHVAVAAAAVLLVVVVAVLLVVAAVAHSLLLLLLCFSAFFEFATVGCPAIVWPKSMLLVSVISHAHTLAHADTNTCKRERGEMWLAKTA